MNASVKPFLFGSVTVSAPYNAEFVAALKAAVPAESRKWDSDAKVWTVSGPYAEVATALVEEFFGEGGKDEAPEPAPETVESMKAGLRAQGAGTGSAANASAWVPVRERTEIDGPREQMVEALRAGQVPMERLEILLKESISEVLRHFPLGVPDARFFYQLQPHHQEEVRQAEAHVRFYQSILEEVRGG